MLKLHSLLVAVFPRENNYFAQAIDRTSNSARCLRMNSCSVRNEFKVNRSFNKRVRYKLNFLTQNLILMSWTRVEANLFLFVGTTAAIKIVCPWILDVVAASAIEFHIEACLGFRPTVVRRNSFEIIALTSTFWIHDNGGGGGKGAQRGRGRRQWGMRKERKAMTTTLAMMAMITARDQTDPS